jgi:hypothetical protein
VQNGRWQITFHQALLNQDIHDRRPNNFAHLDTRHVPRNELERRSKPTPQIGLLLAGRTAVFRDGPLVLDFDLRLAAFAPSGPGAPSAKCCSHLQSHLIVSYESIYELKAHDTGNNSDSLPIVIDPDNSSSDRERESA